MERVRRNTSSTVTEPMPVVDTAFAPPVGQESVVVPPASPVRPAPMTVPVVTVDTHVHPHPHDTVVHDHTVVDSRRRISPSSVVATIASVVLMLWGAVVIARAGLTGDLETPVVEVTSYTATAVLGLIALGGGFVLLLAGLARSRAGVIFVSVILAVAAATLVIEPGTAERTLAGERDFGIAGLIVLGLVALVAVLAPDVDRVARRERID